MGRYYHGIDSKYGLMYEGFLLSYRNTNNTNLVTEGMPISDHTVDEQLEMIMRENSGGRQSFTTKKVHDANALGLSSGSRSRSRSRSGSGSGSGPPQRKSSMHGQQRKSSVSANLSIKGQSPQDLYDQTCSSDDIKIAPSGLAQPISEAGESIYVPPDLTRSSPKREEGRKSFGQAISMSQRKGSIVSLDNEKPWAINMIDYHY